VAPPELAGDDPVADIFHPPEKFVFPPGGIKTEIPVAACFHGFVGQRFHLYEPLVGQQRFNDGLAAAGNADLVDIIFHFDQQPSGFQIPDDFSRASKRSIPLYFPDSSFSVPSLFMMFRLGGSGAFSDFEIILVVCRCYLQSTGPIIHFDVVIGNDRDFASGRRDNGVSTDQFFVSFIIRMHAYGRVGGMVSGRVVAMVM
jgi:hypothetical protein